MNVSRLGDDGDTVTYRADKVRNGRIIAFGRG